MHTFLQPPVTNPHLLRLNVALAHYATEVDDSFCITFLDHHRNPDVFLVIKSGYFVKQYWTTNWEMVSRLQD